MHARGTVQETLLVCGGGYSFEFKVNLFMDGLKRGVSSLSQFSRRFSAFSYSIVQYFLYMFR